jgi:hypothetical protein
MRLLVVGDEIKIVPTAVCIFHHMSRTYVNMVEKQAILRYKKSHKKWLSIHRFSCKNNHKLIFAILVISNGYKKTTIC